MNGRSKYRTDGRTDTQSRFRKGLLYYVSNTDAKNTRIEALSATKAIQKVTTVHAENITLSYASAAA